MYVAIVHNAVVNESSLDEQDVLIQAETVSAAIKDLGHESVMLPCSLNLSEIRRQLEAIKPDIVFNLVESLEGTGRLIHFFPSLLDAMKIPYTGSRAEAIFMTSNKIIAKERMAAADLPTPEWHTQRGSWVTKPRGSENPRWIIKSVWEHASVGLDEDGLVLIQDVAELEDILKKRSSQPVGECFAEAYIEGREFNLSLLEEKEGPQVLPPAEILFEGYGEEKLRIVGYRAKWEADSYEYHHTPRNFDFPPEDEPLLLKLKETAIRCWQVFGLSGYVRVDFRTDSEGGIWILEINTNPCLSPDAGYAAALAQAGISYTEAIRRILNDTQIKNKNL